MKWAVLGGKDQEIRFLCLSEHLNSSGHKNEVEFHHPGPDDFYMVLEKLILKVDQVRLQSPFGELAQGFQNRTTDFVNLVGSADAIIKASDGIWWQENLMHEGFALEFIKHAKHLDLDSHALIVGSGSASKVIMAALIKAGFSKFYVADRFEERAKKTIESLKRRFFKIRFEFIPTGRLMLLPGSSTVLVNATPLVPDNTALRDLYYFNFLKMPATIVDLNLIPPDTPLIEEGKRIGAEAISGYEIAARTDVIWVKRVLNIDLNLDTYRNVLKSTLSSVPFDPAPYTLS